MVLHKTLSWAVQGVVCVLLLTAGCAEVEKKGAEAELKPQEQAPAGKPVVLALKFSEGGLTTYRSAVESEMSLTYEGSMFKDTDFKSGRKHKKVEMTFDQQIQSIDDGGNATARITVKGLKYLSEDKDKRLFEFDSSKEQGADNALNKLLGQSYVIKIAPHGQVLGVIDVSKARTAAAGAYLSNKAAQWLLRADVIMQRHSVSALPAAGKDRVRVGENWSRTKIFSFPILGSKSYEKVYTLAETKEEEGSQIVCVQMKAIPTSEMAEELYKKEGADTFLNMFDSTEEYTGQLKLDVTNGEIKKYSERLWSQWTIVDPEAAEKDTKEPDTIKMGAVRSISLERVD
ncbi:MAG: hypothetical protein JXB29_00795 [Sedimentisphaerales bacterium]|nr:hypothetical protein [Sedimentisphaerales bacterium]